MAKAPLKKTSIQKLLLNHIIDFDFLFFEAKSNSFYYSSNITKVKYNIATFQLNLLELLASLKQFLRLLQFIQKHQKISKIYFWSLESSLSIIFESVLKDTATFKMLTNFFSGFIKFKHKVNCFLILNTQISKKNFLNYLNRNKFNLIQKIDLYNEIYNYSYYKIYNEMNDFKKVIFIGTFISSVFK